MELKVPYFTLVFACFCGGQTEAPQKSEWIHRLYRLMGEFNDLRTLLNSKKWYPKFTVIRDCVGVPDFRFVKPVKMTGEWGVLSCRVLNVRMRTHLFEVA